MLDIKHLLVPSPPYSGERFRLRGRLTSFGFRLSDFLLVSGFWSWISVAGCTVGPQYTPPRVSVNAGYAELPAPTTQPTTLPSQPVARPIPLAEWWTTFHDPQLDALIEPAVKSNLDLRQAGARVREARANRALVAGGEYPTANA